MKEYLESQYTSLEPVESIKPNIEQLSSLRATISIIHDMMCRIEKQKPRNEKRPKV